MSMARLVALTPPGGGRTMTQVFGVPQPVSGAPFIRRDDRQPAAAGFLSRPTDHTPRQAIRVQHSGAPTRGGLTMGAPNFWARKDRGWRRGWPFRFYDVVGDSAHLRTGPRPVGNPSVTMNPPRMLRGLLPSQTAQWQPYQYPLDPSGQQ